SPGSAPPPRGAAPPSRAPARAASCAPPHAPAPPPAPRPGPARAGRSRSSPRSPGSRPAWPRRSPPAAPGDPPTAPRCASSLPPCPGASRLRFRARIERRVQVDEADSAPQVVLDRAQHERRLEPLRAGLVDLLLDQGGEMAEAGRERFRAQLLEQPVLDLGLV